MKLKLYKYGIESKFIHNYNKIYDAIYYYNENNFHLKKRHIKTILYGIELSKKNKSL